MRASVAENNVRELIDLIPHTFAVYGTALGAHREQHVLAHDPDTDIGILEEHFTWERITSAVQNGYRILAVFGMRHYGMEVALEKDSVKTDIMLFYQDKNKPGYRFNCLWENGGRNGVEDAIVHEYDERLLQTELATLGEHNIPTVGKRYLEHVYGADWRTPVTRWDWRTDHLCRRTG